MLPIILHEVDTFLGSEVSPNLTRPGYPIVRLDTHIDKIPEGDVRYFLASNASINRSAGIDYYGNRDREMQPPGPPGIIKAPGYAEVRVWLVDHQVGRWTAILPSFRLASHASEGHAMPESYTWRIAQDIEPPDLTDKSHLLARAVEFICIPFLFGLLSVSGTWKYE